MKPLLTALSFHFQEQIRSKAFRITSVVITLLIFGFFAYNHFMSKDEVVKVSLINTTDYDFSEELLAEGIEGLQLSIKTIDDLDEEKENIKNQEVDHLIVVTEKDTLPNIEYYFHRVPNANVSYGFSNVLQQQYLAKTTAKHQLSQEVVSDLFTPVSTESFMLAENNGSLGIVYVFIFLTYTFIIMYGQGIAMSITGEKSTRVMEVMITKIRPVYMLFAKILTYLFAGLIQVSIFFIAGYICYLIGWIQTNELQIFGFGFDLSQIDAGLIVAFAFFFSTGYLIYALCFAALGSIISRTEDLGSVMGPFMILIMGALVAGMFTMMDPTSTFVKVSTYIPFFSPIVAFSRVVMGEISTLELILSSAVLVVSIALIAFFASRIYVKGVMVYGEKFKWSQIKDLAKEEKTQSL